MSNVPPRLLRETLLAQPAPPSSACLDAETLAAWFDGVLGRRERAMAESHASTCARCQAMLAAIAKTAGPSVTRKWWQTTTIRWLTTIAATSTAAVMLWMKTPEHQPSSALRLNQTNAVENAPAPAPPAAATQPAPRKQTTPVFKRPDDSKDETPRETLKEARRDRITANAEESVAAADDRPGAATAVERDANAAAPAAPPVPLTTDSSSQPAPRAAAKSLPVPFRSLAKEINSTVEVVSPDRNTRWRLVTGGGVEHSTDGGATWQVQSTGAARSLTTGAAPAPTTCWLVGRAGIVLLSTDGRTWQRVAFPETIDLVAIRASDGANATVTAADGRAFTTTDGGKTWR